MSSALETSRRTTLAASYLVNPVVIYSVILLNCVGTHHLYLKVQAADRLVVLGKQWISAVFEIRPH